MANTEGLTDEALCSLLTAASDVERKSHEPRSEASYSSIVRPPSSTLPLEGPRFPLRSLAYREQMMVLSDGERPAAMVIRSSKPPVIHASSSLRKKSDAHRDDDSLFQSEKLKPTESGEEYTDGNQFKSDRNPVILSESIRERPVTANTDHLQATNFGLGRAKQSRFKQRNRNKTGKPSWNVITTITPGGFPSLDYAPVGSLTRQGGMSSLSKDSRCVDVKVRNRTGEDIKSVSHDEIGLGSASDSVIANMSREEIQDGIDEITSILSPASIQYLRERGRSKLSGGPKTSQEINSSAKLSNESSVGLHEPKISKKAEIILEEKRIEEQKEKTAQLLASVHTPEDMDRAYNEALSIGLATEMPSSTLITYEAFSTERQTESDLHVFALLLRSTAPRQRLLGAKNLCSILENDFNEMIKSRCMVLFSADNTNHSIRNRYPLLLPVALRCLIDDAVAISHTSFGRDLLSLGLRCIHFLAMLRVHPLHLICILQANENIERYDPFVLHQTCFMDDALHIPAGSELYPPTTVQSIGHDETTHSCYRADSSATSAEEDSKSFYVDPAWTLLSRMRIIPCLSNALVCASKYISSGLAHADMIFNSICGLLGLLSVRSLGAASAISHHESLLPLIVSHSLSPSTNDSTKVWGDTSLCRPHVALPAVKLLCLLARQSREFAGLETPFSSTITNLQAILCLANPSESELQLQTWCLVFIRILLRYGLATDHVKPLIDLSISHLTPQRQNETGALYLSLFSRILDCARSMTSANLNGDKGVDNNLIMCGIWLSAPANVCVASLKSTVNISDTLDGERNVRLLKFYSAQLAFLSSYLSAVSSTSPFGINLLKAEMNSSLVPSLSEKCCMDVHDSVLLNSKGFIRAFDIALSCAFCVHWNLTNDGTAVPLDQEAASCSFVTSFFHFDETIANADHRSRLANKVVEFVEKIRIKSRSRTICNEFIHPSRRSWFVKAEFRVIRFLCETSPYLMEEGFVRAFAYSLFGRLSVGDESIADYILRQDTLFKVNKNIADISCAHIANEKFLQCSFFRELHNSTVRQMQLKHSTALCFKQMALSTNNICALASLISGFRLMSVSEKTLFLPVGGTWLWNVLSSTFIIQTNSDPSAAKSSIGEITGIVSHALGLIFHTEFSETSAHCYPLSVNNGVKLYHLSNVCLYPESILRDDFIHSVTSIIFEELSTTAPDSNLVADFIEACHDHSRLSRDAITLTSNSDIRGADEMNPNHPFISHHSNILERERMIALGDFVDDMCLSYMEYGGQYDVFTRVMRFFLRSEFSSEIAISVLSKLRPVLNVFTLEEDTATTYSSLLASVSGGLPSVDSSHRDPPDVLDFVSELLKMTEKKLKRHDYIYLLSVALLCRNLASNIQRCECGLQKMRHRLNGIQLSVFFDIVNVCKQFLSEGNGSRENLITCVMDVCLNETGVTKSGLLSDDVWAEAISSVDNIKFSLTSV